MNLRICALVIVVILSCVSLAGCCSPSGAFARSEERAENLGDSIQNIFLDGDGVN